MMNEGYSDLVNVVNERLKKFNYGADQEIKIPNIVFITYVKRPNLLKVRNLCAIVDIPSHLKDFSMIQGLFKNIETGLLNKYGNAFLWKELEIIYIVFSSPEIFKIIQDHGGKVINQTAFSLNSMMGLSFINKGDHNYFTYSNWGLYFCGDHLKEVDALVKEWCSSKR